MGLLTVLRKVRQKERELRVLMVGLDNAGKTTATASLTGGDPAAVAPTVGFEIRTVEVRGRLAGGDAAAAAAAAAGPPSLPRRVNIWDVGGQKTLRPFWRNYFEATDGLVWVVDAADRARLPDAARELATLLAEARLAATPLLVLANKQDVAGAASGEEVAGALGLTGGGDADAATPSLAARPWRVVPTSARDGDGVAFGFDWLLDAVAAAAGAGGGVGEDG